MRPKLGIVAGGGQLPRQLLTCCRDEHRAVFIVAFDGITDPDLVLDTDHRWVRLGAVGRLLQALKKAQVEEVVLAGPVGRPSLGSLRPDMRALKIVPKLIASEESDASLLKIVIEELEQEGFTVVGAQDVASALLVGDGPMGRVQPRREDARDIARGVEVASAIGAVDIGQAAVIQHGIVLGVEAVEGTDALVNRCGALKRDGPGGVLVKVKKPGQDRRADLPTIGLGTVQCAVDAGLRGIAVEADATLFVDRDDAIALADSRDLFVIGVRPAEILAGVQRPLRPAPQ